MSNFPDSTPTPTPVPPTERKNFTIYLVLGVLACFCCTPLGAITIVMAVLGNNSYDRGDKADGDSKFKIAKICLIIGFVLAILFAIVYIVLIAVSASDALSTTASTAYPNLDF